jgi:hypothetical protein
MDDGDLQYLQTFLQSGPTSGSKQESNLAPPDAFRDFIESLDLDQDGDTR